jgi:hypothetical protein
MWKPLLQNHQFSVHADIANKQIMMQIYHKPNEYETLLQLAEHDFFELMYAFISINREFQGEKPYFID